ncbi:MAG: hypothetical protein MJ197_08755 [Bacteroidales bacterium]|nr:hypothetical protein [Bacteroidales bacterium]
MKVKEKKKRAEKILKEYKVLVKKGNQLLEAKEKLAEKYNLPTTQIYRILLKEQQLYNATNKI